MGVNWASRYHETYRTKYQQILLDLAQYERELGETLQEDQQSVCFRRAAELYQAYAFATLPKDELELERGRLAGGDSEQALRHSIAMYSRGKDAISARRVYGRYIEQMKQYCPTWEADSRTQKLWQRISQGSASSR